MRMYATAINPLDCQIRCGDDADDVSLSDIIGHNTSGVVNVWQPSNLMSAFGAVSIAGRRPKWAQS